MLEIGQIVKLEGNKEYIVANIIDAHSLKYAFLISNFKPLNIIISTVKNDSNGKIVLEEVKSNEEVEYILSKIMSSKSDE